MPKIVRMGGLNLSDDVVKIRDVGPSPMPKGAAQKRMRPGRELGPAEETDFDADGMEAEEDLEEGFEPEDFRSTPSVSSSAAIKEEIVQGAMAEAGRILEDAIRQAEEAKNEQLAGIQQEAETIRWQAAEEGRRQGLTEAVEQMQQVAAELEGAVARFEGERAGFEAEYEDQLQWMAIEIASKVLAKKVEDNDAEMLEMVQKAVQSVKSEPWIRVEVASDMTHLIDRLCAIYDGQANVEVSPIPAEGGTVHIETPSGVVDASLRTQLENLRDYFAQAPN